MASILRSIIAGPRAKHQESNLDLCYVTPFLIATSGPSATYPQRAYRNPLDLLVNYLDKTHGNEWCIWEFRAEGTGYPDEEVYGRVRHYPWPDHHPPPFAVIPLAMAGMKQWLDGEEAGKKSGGKKRVIIVHCKAGKGRSGTMASSYLMSHCGWTMEEALARFTERRMRPGFGQGVSIQSQLRYVGYVDRWTRGAKKYVERSVEILEVHVWGLRDGVKVAVEGYVEEGKVIKVYHVFDKKERLVVEGTAPGGQGIADMFTDMAGYGTKNSSEPTARNASTDSISTTSRIEKSRKKVGISIGSKTQIKSSSSSDDESGGGAVMFKPHKPLIVAGSDINIDFERRNKAGYGLTMVTSVAHTWFNTFFEGNGPEQDGKANETGIFEMEWDKMDGIKGSLRKGTRAFDRFAVVWKMHGQNSGAPGAGKQVNEPGSNSPVDDMAPADWKQGAAEPSKIMAKDLGLRVESPASASVSKASSFQSTKSRKEKNVEEESDDDSFKGLKSGGMLHEGMADFGEPDKMSAPGTGMDGMVDIGKQPQPEGAKTTLADIVSSFTSTSKVRHTSGS